MKKQLITQIAFTLFCLIVNAQEVNQPANWPNTSWSLSGTYDSDYLDANPTTSNGATSFSFNDDDAGGSSVNNVAAESPIIDVSGAIGFNETNLLVSFEYVYNIYENETLLIEYWDADTEQWTTWGFEIPENSNSNDDFCDATATIFNSEILDIALFTVNQLENFRYRISYDDNGSYGWGFCVDSPTLVSTAPPACPSVTDLTPNNITYNSAMVTWTAGSTETSWQVAITFASEEAPTSGTQTTNTNFSFSSLNQQTAYTAYVRANCLADGFSNWSSITFTTGEDLSNYPVTFTPNTINTSEFYDIALVDLNGDFLDDIVSVGATNINVHYQLVSGGFNEVDIATTAADFLPTWSLAAGDIDGNGYNDLLYGSGSGVTFMKANDLGTSYTEISGTDYVFSQRSNFIDINNDGHLDASVCHDVEANVYYINDGSGNLTFYQGQSSVLPNGIGLTPGGGNYGTIWVDYDNDRDMDLFIAKCRGGSTTISTNELWRNDGNGVYVNVADSNEWYNNNYPNVGHNNSSNLGDNVQTWSSAWGDFDNDGDLDVYVGASSTSNGDSKLMQNNGDGSFTDVTAGSGVLAASLGIENISADFDNDGYLDILSNGNILFGNGDLTFNNYASNVPPSGAIGDANNDGFIDVFRNGTVYLNNTNSNNWIKLNTVGTASNSNGIGARVEIETASGTQIRDVRSGQGFEFMSSLNTHFGIGLDTAITNITIYWPSGIIDQLNNPEINTTHTVVEGSLLTVEDQNLSDMTIFPNPVNDIINIETKANLTNKIASVFDINGRRIISHKLKSNTLNVSYLKPGIYFLRLESEGKTMLREFIKN